MGGRLAGKAAFVTGAASGLGKAIAMADKSGGGVSELGTADPAISSRRLKLQTDYGQAMMWSKGFAADEASAAYARVGSLPHRPATAMSETSSTTRDGYAPSFAARSSWLVSVPNCFCTKREHPAM